MDHQLVTTYDRARQAHETAVHALTALAARIAIATVVNVLPDAHTIDVHGEMNEDWLPTLRIQRVRDLHGRVLYDVREGHEDSTVETAIDAANTEYLDLLVDLTGDEFMGSATSPAGDPPQGAQAELHLLPSGLAFVVSI